MQNLYYRTNDSDHMRIERLFRTLEGKTSEIFVEIRNAVQKQLSHVNILERDIHVLIKFMLLSQRRSKQYRDDVKNPRRENDHMFQRMFETSKTNGLSDNPGEVWLEQLLYLLETSHESLLTAAADTGGGSSNPAAKTYKYFHETYALQIWRAAESYEFFLNESLVDFEGDTQSFIGVEKNETGSQLIWMTTDDMIHLILPINPEIAIVFCNESRCWESPFADAMHRCNIPFPQNSLLSKAPHKDIIMEHVPAKRKKGKTWPATVEWKVSIDRLSQQHHRIIASYSLSHARSIVVVRNRARFEKARKELKAFAKEREETWKSHGTRYGDQSDRQHANEEGTEISPDQLNRMVDDRCSALDEVLHTIKNTREIPQRSKENMYKFWMAFQTIHMLYAEATKSPRICVMHPALKAAFEADYPPKNIEHRDLVTLDFAGFIDYGLGEETFVHLISDIEKKISELVAAETFQSLFEATGNSFELPSESLSQQIDKELNEEPHRQQDEFINNPVYKSIFRAAQTFDTLMWMYEERQDILATFIKEYAMPMEDTQPNLVRMRARRE